MKKYAFSITENNKLKSVGSKAPDFDQMVYIHSLNKQLEQRVL
jgi:hypothetical protein